MLPFSTINTVKKPQMDMQEVSQIKEFHGKFVWDAEKGVLYVVSPKGGLYGECMRRIGAPPNVAFDPAQIMRDLGVNVNSISEVNVDEDTGSAGEVRKDRPADRDGEEKPQRPTPGPFRTRGASGSKPRVSFGASPSGTGLELTEDSDSEE